MTATIFTVTLPFGTPRRLIRALTLRALRPLSLTLVLRLTVIVSDLKTTPRGRRMRTVNLRLLRQRPAEGSGNS